MSFSETISPLLGRFIQIWFYGTAAADIVTRWQQIVSDLAAKQVPVPPLALLVVLVLIFMGCLSLFLGWHARHGAVLLFALTILAAVVMHDYWNINDPVLRGEQFRIFARDWAIAGGLLLMVGMGPGPFSVDYRSDNRGQGSHVSKRRR
jgi:putative oxidoreductase